MLKEKFLKYFSVACRRGLAQITDQQRTTCNAGGCTGDFACQTIGSRSVCCAKNDYICSPRGGLPTVVTATGPNGGNPGIALADTITRYFYNSGSRTCEAFQWNQQNGDFNNFASQQDCLSYCGSGEMKVCQIAFLFSSRLSFRRGRPFQLNPTQSMGPLDWNCEKSNLIGSSRNSSKINLDWCEKGTRTLEEYRRFCNFCIHLEIFLKRSQILHFV